MLLITVFILSSFLDASPRKDNVVKSPYLTNSTYISIAVINVCWVKKWSRGLIGA